MKRCLAFLLLLSLCVPAGAGSLLSTQYTASWASPDFFPLGASRVQIATVQDESGHPASFDILNYLSGRIREQIAAGGLTVASSDDAAAVVADVSVHLYQEGGTFARWLGGGLGAAYVVVQASFHKPGQPTGGELVTVSVIGGGGLFSAGAEKTVLDDAAEQVVAFLKGDARK